MARPSLRRRDGWKRSICCYCGVGCGVKVQTRNGIVSAVRGDEDHPVNRGKLCAKGALLPDIFVEEARLLHPHVRDVKGSGPRRTSWDEAIERAAGAIRRAVDEHGPDSVMMYGSGQLVTEDYYLFGKLAKGYIGTNNQDTNSRLCMASAVTAYTMTFGADAPPAGYADIEEANTFLIVGANMEACHPILFERIKARKRAAKDRVKVIVVDPRATRTTEIADLHLALRPGTDVALLQSLLFEVRLAGGLDETYLREHTTGWEHVADSLDGWSAERAVEVTGLDAVDILEAAHIIAHNGPMLTFWTMGANQSTSGVDKNLALINLSLATGNIGKPGAGPMSLTGQPNAMGGREQGGLATTLPGHRQVNNPEHRAEVEQAWGVPPGAISDRPGVTAIEMVERLERGEVKVIWIAATNPVASLPNSDRVRAAFERAETVIVQDAYHPTETTQVADVLLPAAQWSERAGTMTNSERRICLLEQVSRPPGEALPDWQIICRIAAAPGYGDAFQYDGLEEIFYEYRELSRGRDMDITGISYPLLAQHRAGIQWPYPSTARSGPPEDGRRLFEDGRFQTADGRARMHVPQSTLPAESIDDDYPYALITGRVKDQWHTMTRTGRSAKLIKSERQPFLELNPSDAVGLGIRDRDRVRVSSRRGAFEVTARVSNGIRPGSVFAPFHWGSLWADSGSSNASASEAVDPRSKQPELKFAAVRIEPVAAD
ncbi:MAG: nitrate reductase [Chloroflexi bacterium]|nr:nitrate reductase [Chloroflexota bacterium]